MSNRPKVTEVRYDQGSHSLVVKIDTPLVPSLAPKVTRILRQLDGVVSVIYDGEDNEFGVWLVGPVVLLDVNATSQRIWWTVHTAINPTAKLPEALTASVVRGRRESREWAVTLNYRANNALLEALGMSSLISEVRVSDNECTLLFCVPQDVDKTKVLAEVNRAVQRSQFLTPPRYRLVRRTDQEKGSDHVVLMANRRLPVTLPAELREIGGITEANITRNGHGVELWLDNIDYTQPPIDTALRLIGRACP